jgi:hypothetical protein
MLWFACCGRSLQMFAFCGRSLRMLDLSTPSFRVRAQGGKLLKLAKGTELPTINGSPCTGRPMFMFWFCNLQHQSFYEQSSIILFQIYLA